MRCWLLLRRRRDRCANECDASMGGTHSTRLRRSTAAHFSGGLLFAGCIERSDTLQSRCALFYCYEQAWLLRCQTKLHSYACCWVEAQPAAIALRRRGSVMCLLVRVSKALCGNAGTFNTRRGRSMCDPCTPGFYCPNQTMVTPITCPAGSYCPSNSTIPTRCPAGSFSNATHASAMTGS